MGAIIKFGDKINAIKKTHMTEKLTKSKILYFHEKKRRR